MAEIPVERKTGGGLPWWLLPLLALLILIPLLFFFTRGCGEGAVVGNANNGNANRTVVTTTNTTTNTTTANSTAVVTNTNAAANTSSANNEAVTDTSYFGGVNDKSSLVGRRANFTNARVEKVLSDHVFTVKSGSGDMYVYLDGSQDSAGGEEKIVRVKDGQNLNLSGEFRRVPTRELKEETESRKDGTLTAKEYDNMKGQQVYLHARINNPGAAK